MFRTWRQRKGNRISTGTARPARRQIPTPFRVRTRLVVEQLEDRTLPSIQLLGIPTWFPQGPAPIENGVTVNALPDNSASGAVAAVVAAPGTAPGSYNAYLAAVNGGVFHAYIPPGTLEDNGSLPPSSLAWTPLTDNLPSLATASLALDPTDTSGNTLWVGTGSVSSNGNNGPPGIGLLVTTDGGKTWHVKGNAQLANQQILCVLPTAQTFPGGGQVVLVASRQTGIWWSDDGGNTFQNVIAGQGAQVIEDATNPSWFYAAVPGSPGVWWSTSYGQTWTPVNDNASMIGAGDLRIADAPGVLYVATIGQPTNPPPYSATNLPKGNITGVWEAPITNFGPQLFTAIGTAPSGFEQSVLTGTFSYPAQLALAVDPTNPNLVYLSTSGNVTTSIIYRGDATTGSWTSLTSPFTQPHTDSRSLTFFPGSDDLVETDDGGIYDLPNAATAVPVPPTLNFTHWIALQGDLQDTEFFSVGLDTFHNEEVGGSQDNGTPFQAPPVSSFWQLIDGGDGGPVAVDNSLPGNGTAYLYADGVLERPGPSPLALSGLSAQDQATYTAAQGTDTSYPIALDPYLLGKGEALFFGMSQLYESTNAGATVFAPIVIGTSTGNVVAIAAGSAPDPLTAYYSTTTGLLFFRNKNTPVISGQNVFEQVTPPPPGFPANDTFIRIAIDPQNASTAFLLDAQSNVYRLTLSPSNNPTWTPITGNLTQIATIVAARDPGTGKPLQSFENLQSIDVYDPTGADPVVLVGGLGGVYRGFESGSTFAWSQYGTGLPNSLVNDLHYVPANSKTSYGDVLLAGTLGRGVWAVPNASITLAQPETLEVVANPGDTIQLSLDATNPNLLDAQETSQGGGTSLLIVPLTQITAITVDATGGNVTLDVNENPGVQQGAGPIALPNPVSPNCALQYNGGTGDTLVVDDTLDAAAETVTLGTDQILGLGMSMCYNNVAKVQLKGGTDPNDVDYYTLSNTDASVQTELDLGTAFNQVDVLQTAGPPGSNTPAVTINGIGNDDDVTVGASGTDSKTLALGNLANIVGTVELIGVGGAAQAGVVIDDEHDRAPSMWQVEGPSSQFGRPLPFVSWSSGANSALILLKNIIGVNLNGGGGLTNLFELSPALGNLDLLPALISVNAAAKNPDSGKVVTNILSLNDQNTMDSNVAWSIDGSAPGTGQVSRSPSAGVTQPMVDFSNIFNTDPTKASLTIIGGAGPKQGATANNAFQLSPGMQDQNLDNLPTFVAINGGTALDTLVVDDQKLSVGNTWQINGATLVRSHQKTGTLPADTSTVQFSKIGTLTINGSSTAPTFFGVGSTVSGTATIIQGGSAANSFDVGSDGTFAGKVGGIVSSLMLNAGSAKGNSLTLDDTGNTTYVDGVNLNPTSAVGVTGTHEGFFGTGGSLTYSGFTGVVLDATAFHIPSGPPLNFSSGSVITVLPQTGMLFTINGMGSPSAFPGNSLTVSTANGGVTLNTKTTPFSYYFTSDKSMTPVVQFTDMQILKPAGWLVAAPDAGYRPEVKVYNAQSGVLRFGITAFDPTFRGGVRVAVGDVNGDGIPDIIAAQGPADDAGGDSLVHVYDGTTGKPLAGPLGSFDPFPGFHGGLYVAAADLTGAGHADVIVGQDAGGQGWVKVFSGADGSLLAQFRPFGPAFAGGVRLAAGPVGSNGHVDVVAGEGPGGPPLVRVFDGPDLLAGLSTPVASFDAFDPGFTGGVYVATGLIHGQGQPPAAIIVGEGAGGEPRVSVFDGTGTPLQSFLAFDRGFKGGVRVAAADVNGDGRSDIIAAEGPGPGSLPEVRGFDGVSLKRIDQFFAFPANFRDGLYVAGGGRWGLFNPAATEPGSHGGRPSIDPGRPSFVPPPEFASSGTAAGASGDTPSGQPLRQAHDTAIATFAAPAALKASSGAPRDLLAGFWDGDIRWLDALLEDLLLRHGSNGGFLEFAIS
jgi:hypothetical protein